MPGSSFTLESLKTYIPGIGRNRFMGIYSLETYFRGREGGLGREG